MDGKVSMSRPVVSGILSVNLTVSSLTSRLIGLAKTHKNTSPQRRLVSPVTIFIFRCAFWVILMIFGMTHQLI